MSWRLVNFLGKKKKKTDSQAIISAFPKIQSSVAFHSAQAREVPGGGRPANKNLCCKLQLQQLLLLLWLPNKREKPMSFSIKILKSCRALCTFHFSILERVLKLTHLRYYKSKQNSSRSVK